MPLLIIALGESSVGHTFFEIPLRVDPFLIRTCNKRFEDVCVFAGIQVVGALADVEMEDVARELGGFGRGGANTCSSRVKMIVQSRVGFPVVIIVVVVEQAVDGFGVHDVALWVGERAHGFVSPAV